MKHQWSTNETGVTNAAGEYQTRAFTGDYRVSAQIGGKIVEKKAALSAGGAIVRLAL